MDIVRRRVPASAATLRAAGVPPVLARVYAARGIDSLADLDTGFAALPSYDSLKGINAAASRLADAVERRERILVVADYDADGATACAVAVRGLRGMGAEVEFIVPSRFADGYGLTPEIVVQALARRPRLIVTVDNGIASHQGVEAAMRAGVDTLITDHHLPAATLPATPWIVNPNQPGCAFPSKHIAGVGVMFYVLLALRAELRQRGHFAAGGEPQLASLLDLVALGTVADVVRLDSLNRALVAQGLSRIRAGRAHPGVAALFAAAGREQRRATSYDLGFVAGPRLNAAGRLADMSVGIRCLLADTAAAALPLATALDRLNRERREIEAGMHDSALAAIDAVGGAGDTYSLALFDEGWHQGVVGIVASRLKDRFHRPALVFARGRDGELKGSGRSVPGLHLRDALDLVDKRAPGLIRRFGGHAFAAGLSLAEADLPRFRELFEAVARENLSPAQLARVLETDGELGANELDADLARATRDAVWGQGFEAPLFDGWFDVADQRVVAGKHSKLSVRRVDVSSPAAYPAMLFGHAAALPPRIRAAYRPDLNEWRGTESLQLIVTHWQPATD